MQWMVMPYRRYAEFGGRSQRAEYWYFALFMVLVQVAVHAVFGHVVTQNTGGALHYSATLTGPANTALDLFTLANVIPHLAVSVRRLHDIGRTGWLLLLYLVPILGWFALLVLFCLDGTSGPNAYGADPKRPYDLDAFA